MTPEQADRVDRILAMLYSEARPAWARNLTTAVREVKHWRRKAQRISANEGSLYQALAYKLAKQGVYGTE